MTTEHSTSTEYTYTYDQYGNITSITDSAGKVTKYYYDDLQQLTREDNPYYNQTYVYTYNDAGNRTKKETYTYTTGSLSGASPSKTQSLAYYSATGWYDMLWLCNDGSGGSAIGYDAIGNPTTYHTDAASYTFTWKNGRQLATATKNGTTNIYKYNDSGIRTSKKVGNVEHVYTLNGSQIVSETWGNNTLIYLYDETGSPIGMQYRTSSMVEGVFVNFFFEKNLFGDIVAVYNESGTKVITYTYDAWGNHTPNVLNSTGNNTYASYNPFRYRGYYYDTETEFYYLQSRYYDPVTGRFLNADGYINANGDLIGYNMYAYCSNNPVMYTDPTGYAEVDIKDDEDGNPLNDFGPVYTSNGNMLGSGRINGGGTSANLVTALSLTATVATETTLIYAAATGTTTVSDFSYSFTTGADSLTFGLSLVIDFDSGCVELYPHVGKSKGFSSGFTYSTGLIENYQGIGSYGGWFVQAGAGCFLGLNHCYDPTTDYSDAIKATTITFGNDFGYSAGVDWYFDPLVLREPK